MKKNFTLLLLLLSFSAMAQHQAKGTGSAAVTFGNEWINYTQKYYKFPITQDGVYRLDSAALANSGISVSSINPKKFQIFGRGAEIPIYVEGEADGTFNSSDYIEFYAQKNDGFADAPLYPNGLHPNPYYSLFNDTANYFLTWNTSTANLRFAAVEDTIFSPFTPVNYFLKEIVYTNPVVYHEGKTTGYQSTDPTYDKTEGWFGSYFEVGSTVNYPLATPKVFSGGPDATVRMNLAGASDISIYPDHHLVIEYLNAGGSYIQLHDTIFEGYELLQLSGVVPASQLGAVTDFKLNSMNLPGATGGDYTALSYIQMKYPHTTDMEGASTFKFFLNDHLFQTKSYLNFSNYSGTGNIHLYDLTNNKRFEVFPNAGQYRVLVPNSSSEKICVLVGDNQVTKITSVVPVTPSAVFTDYSTVALDSVFLIITHKSLMADAQDYKNYRQSPNGRSHNVVIADVDELYDQFAYGIKKHPFSIRNFCDFAINTWLTPPRNLFLFGKAIVAHSARKSVLNYAASLVPTMGNPACDNLLTAGLSGTFLEPAIFTGRIAAKNPADAQTYLNKVIEYEQPLLSGDAPPEWKKHILHFAGGSNSYEQYLFQSYVNGFKKTIEDTLFGGMVHSFFKTTSAPIQLTLTDSVKNLFNNGVSLITFFGHASSTGFEQSLDAASNYSNQGKYPMMIANACYSGNIHAPVYQAGNQIITSTSEEYVLIPNKGAIGFLAAVGLGIAYPLSQYTGDIYKNIGQKLYGKTIGECIKQTIVNVQGAGLDPSMRNTVLEMTLHGDPALIINAFSGPDYAVAESSIYFTGKNNVSVPISTVIDSFNVNVVVTNLGKLTGDSLSVEITRKFPSGNSFVYNRTLANVHFRDTLTLTLPVDKINGGGLNTFSVKADAPDYITELSESNNDTQVPLYISSGDIIPVYPYKYAIVPNDTVTLTASVGNPFAPVRNYRFEMDTTDLFNSSELKSKIISHAGGIVEWVNPATLKDSMVYFWRVRRDTADTTNFKWNESSFQYINNKRGWEQAHFFQYKNDDYTFVKYNRPVRTFNFTALGTKVICHTYGNPNLELTAWTGTQWQLDFKVQESGGCTYSPAIYIAVIDPVTLKAWGTHYGNLNPTHSFGNYNDLNYCHERVQPVFMFFPQDSAQAAGMKNMLTNAIPDGHYILAYSWVQANFQKWADASLYSTFINLGADTNIRHLPDAIPYIFFAKKGDTTTAKEVIGSSSTAYINLTEDITGNSKQGTITSELIGPAARWDSLSWRQMPLETPTKDSIYVSVIGVKSTGAEDVLMQNLIPGAGGDVYLSAISTDIYPYLKLNAYVKDDTLLTPAQLLKWQVFYQPAPEVAVDPSQWFSLNADTMQEGESVKFQVAVKNVSEFYMDSMLVKFWIQDANRVNHDLAAYMSEPLPAGETLRCSVVAPTLGYPGSNTLWMEINPVNQPKERNEQYHFNNIAVVGVFVGKDIINPMLDVTFDGIHILNGDIVSAKPNILIKLKDENTFLALDDSLDFAVFIKKPGDATSHRVGWSSELGFTKAVLPNNSAKINYVPNFTQDGTYELIVQAKDKSNNLSGNIDYNIKFEVVNKPTVTEVLNYPNPFSTATKFVFTLTGSEIPQYFKIQVMTITGKVVREITKEELGYIHIGRNITEYAWDGKDNFGDQLANGVYLYRVMTQLNGQSIEHKETEADQYFNKGFGKMYLMR